MASKRATWHHPKRVTFHRAVIFGDEPADETASIRPSPSLPCVVKWTTSLEMNCRHDKPLLHSNSTSHLHFTEQRRQQPSPLEDAKKRYFSSEGRFSIIDEQSKDSGSSTESDEDSPLPKVPTVPQKVSTTPAFSQSLPHPHMASAASVSRFRIVPVESRYKRGRWECFDYYQKELPRNSKVSCPEPPRALANLHSTDRSVRSWTTELSPGPATAPLPASKTSTFQFGDHLHRSSSLKHKALNVDVKQGRMTPTEMLQTGLESTLNTAEIKKKENNKGSTATGHNGNSPSTVAIDSKIEQAMDLVKSHLMFAVREEVEGLRQKIGELEVHIQHLESENAILREHISPDMLQGGGGLHNPR